MALQDAVGFDFIVILRRLSLLLAHFIILHRLSLCLACIFVTHLILHLTWVYCHWIGWVSKPPNSHSVGL